MLRPILVLIALGGFVAACGSSPPAQPKPQAVSIVALGDSVPRGTNCDCRPYPPLTADGLTTADRTVTATNDSVAGYTTANVLHQVESDAAVIDHLRPAHVVEIEVGANDVGYNTGSCGTSVDCYAPRIPTIEKNLKTIVQRVRNLAQGHQVLVVLLDYWSVWLGGQYAAAKGEAYVNAAEAVTDQVNQVIKSTATNTGSGYVDLRAAFKGPDYAYDETQYLSNDGDHPNAAGHEQIARATEAVIEKSL